MAGRMSSHADERSGSVPEGFTLSMALMDCLPVAFFCVGAGVLATRFESPLFRVGVVLIVLAGALKVCWKLVIALARRDIRLLNRQMRYLMPVGFALVIISLVVDRAKWSPVAVLAHVTAMPSLLFLVAGVAGMFLMSWFARHLDGRDAKANWREQAVNGISQLCIMLAIVL
ncbi:hypothetical protein [Tractidigestivibacter scatoligenes]|uniref:hypothetical protein n=1 Tax=Tractidigestivibacter scatoligenes TaxID=1299998 RepID=UPI002F358C24